MNGIEILEKAEANIFDVRANQIRMMAAEGNALLASNWYVERIARFRQWLGAGTIEDGFRPDASFFETFLGHHKLGALTLLSAYEKEPAITPEYREHEIEGLKAVALQAQRQGHIDWNLDSYFAAAPPPPLRSRG
jgi:hypothetical protein